MLRVRGLMAIWILLAIGPLGSGANATQEEEQCSGCYAAPGTNTTQTNSAGTIWVDILMQSGECEPDTCDVLIGCATWVTRQWSLTSPRTVVLCDKQGPGPWPCRFKGNSQSGTDIQFEFLGCGAIKEYHLTVAGTGLSAFTWGNCTPCVQ